MEQPRLGSSDRLGVGKHNRIPLIITTHSDGVLNENYDRLTFSKVKIAITQRDQEALSKA